MLSRTHFGVEPKFFRSFSNLILNLENCEALGTVVKPQISRSSELRLRMFIKSEVSAIDSIDLRIKAEIIEDNL